ncbi:MAG: hypothetical protein WD046_14075 [Paracoccaceae bacterium]
MAIDFVLIALEARRKQLEEYVVTALDRKITEAIRKARFNAPFGDSDEWVQGYPAPPRRFPLREANKNLTALIEKVVTEHEATFKGQYVIKFKVEFAVKKTPSIMDDWPPLNVVTPNLLYRFEWATRKFSARKYTLKDGDTPFRVSLRMYDTGIFWQDILDANKGRIAVADNKFLMCAILDIPAKEVPLILYDLKSPKPKLADGIPFAKTYPSVSYEVKAKSNGLTQMYVTPQFIVSYTLYVEGSVLATRKGAIPIKFKADKEQTEVTRTLKGVDFGYQITGASLSGFTLKSQFAKSPVKFKATVTSDAKFSLKAEVPVEFTVKNITVEGKLSLIMECTVVPNPRAPKSVPTRKKIMDFVWDHKWEIVTIAVPGGMVLRGAKLGLKVGGLGVRRLVPLAL